MRDVYLHYDPISSGYIGILPEGPLVILDEVFETLKLVYFQSGSATASIRVGKYTPNGTTNLRKILNKRCAQQKCYKNVSDSLRIMLSS